MEKKPEARRKLLEELKELFGPAFGTALEAHGRSFAERLRDDEGFVAEARKLFEEGEVRGEFPALSGLLAGASEEEREEFFRDGWAREVLPSSCSTLRKPWDFALWYGNFDAYREDLYSGMALRRSGNLGHLRRGQRGGREAEPRRHRLRRDAPDRPARARSPEELEREPRNP